jgi:hypothetical protein
MICPQAAESLTSYIDEHNRFILNGEPFFPLGLYVAQCSMYDQSVQLDEIANSPFDTLMNYSINRCGNDAEDGDISNYLDQLELESRNLKLIFSLVKVEEGDLNGRPLDIDIIEHKVNTFQNRSAIISWYMQEERDPDVCESELEAAYNKIRELDNNHPVWSVIGGWSWNIDWLTRLADTTDIVGVDPYPIPGMPITLVSQMADAAISTGKPLWLVPQIFAWPGERPPTRAEMRAMTYLAVNHGAKGLIYYSYSDIVGYSDYDTRWPQIKKIAAEIDQLKSVFLSTYQTNDTDIVCNNKYIDFKLTREGNTYYLFAVNTAVNTDGDPIPISGVSFDINLASAPSKFTVLFENRQVEVNNGSFTDNFDGDDYEVHIYEADSDGDGLSDSEDNCPSRLNPQQEDFDGDGVGDACESGPDGSKPDYDGNGDYIPDSQQVNVASVYTHDGQYYVTLASPDDTTPLSDVQAVDNPSESDAPGDMAFPYGLFHFTVNVRLGDSTTVTFYSPEAVSSGTKWYKYDTINGWEDYSDHATFSADRRSVTLELKDGGYGDGDGTEDGRIVDPSGLGTPSSAPPNGGTTVGGGGGSSGGACFIATVAFGAPMEKHVTTLRSFKDTYLLPCALGRIFVRSYNKYSPPLAHFVAKHEILKAAARISLLPLVAISYATLHFGPVVTLCMLVVLLILPILLVLSCRRKAAAVR